MPDSANKIVTKKRSGRKRQNKVRKRKIGKFTNVYAKVREGERENKQNYSKTQDIHKKR